MAHADYDGEMATIELFARDVARAITMQYVNADDEIISRETHKVIDAVFARFLDKHKLRDTHNVRHAFMTCFVDDVYEYAREIITTYN